MRALLLRVTAALGLLVAAAPAAQAASAGPGCLSNQAAVAHYAAGVLVKPQPAHGPIPCGMQTGYGGGESAIAVTNSGAVFYSPAVQATAGVQTQYFLGGNSAFARSTDLGATWKFVNPIGLDDSFLTALAGPGPERLSGQLGYPAWDQIDDKFFVDRATGRLFWTDPDVPSQVVLYTDDSGVSWHESVLPVGFGGEWTQVTTAKPLTSHPSGYPAVVYACGEYDSVSRDVTQELEGDLCQKSLDGGQTWQVAGQGFFGSPLATHPQCNGQPESPNFSPWAAPDPQGRLYELLFCDGHSYLVRSSDEAASWPIYAQLPFKIANVGPGATGSAELRTDAEGNMYLAWSDPGNPNPNSAYAPGTVYLATSRDAGLHWSAPMKVLAPGVLGIRTHFGFDVAAPGQVAISYLGTTAARHGGFDGYITMTDDALAAHPVFWSGVTNPLSQAPLDNGGRGSSNGLALDYVSVAIGPDGIPWASFWDACGSTVPQPTAGCPPSRAPAGTQSLGYVDWAGRLTALPAIAPGRGPRCPRATGSLHADLLGPVRLGMTRGALLRRLPLHDPIVYGFEDHCLAYGPGIRVHYPSRRLLAALPRRLRLQVAGRVTIALTANRHYALHGVRPGVRVAAIRSRLHLGSPIVSGRNVFYVLPGRLSTGLLETRRGTVVDVGITLKRLTRGSRATRRFLRDL